MPPPRKKAPRKTIKASKNTDVPQVQRRVCKKHMTEMVFVPDKLRWECPNADCKVVAYPTLGDDTGRPIMGRGEVELVVVGGQDDGKETVLLHCVDNHVTIDVSDHLVKAQAIHVDTDGRGEKTYTLLEKPEPGETRYMVTLVFDRAVAMEVGK